MSHYIIIPSDYNSPIIAHSYCLDRTTFTSREKATEYLAGAQSLTPYLRSRMRVIELPVSQINRFIRTNHPHQLFPNGMVVGIVSYPDRNLTLRRLIREQPEIEEVFRLINTYGRERDGILDRSPVDQGSRHKVQCYLPGAGYVLGSSDYIYPSRFLSPDGISSLI